VSRRGRAVGFLLLALTAAGLAAGIANGYGSRVARGYGALRAVVVASVDLAPGKVLGPARVSSALEVRRVPQRFVPPGALAAPAEALGLAPQAAIPAGSYLLAAQLRPPRPRSARPPGLEADLHPVAISVAGADSLLAAGPLAPGAKVDVVVTTEPDGSGPGRAYVAVAGVPLLALRPDAESAGPGSIAVATLGLSRRQALHLIAAESFARQLTLLPGG
jgi:Flp pilus assembly protein CpaB